MIKDTFWVFRSFGLMAGMRFLFNSIITQFKRLLPKKEDDRTFEQLSDEEAMWTAWAFGVHTWTDRDDLNRQWNKFEKSLKQRN
jgi:hypothetical protein